MEAGVEWEILSKEVIELYKAGKFDRAAVVAKKSPGSRTKKHRARPSRCCQEPEQSSINL